MFKASPEIMLIPYAAHNLVKDDDYINLIIVSEMSLHSV